jgi:molybdate transport system regulatory protein
MKAGNRALGVRIRLVLAPEVAVGPGKADLLDAIAATGSIAAAGRKLGMSYKRAWHLVESLNRGFAEPLVLASRGGSGHGGAVLTRLGSEVLEAYRRIERASAAAAGDDLARLRERLAPAVPPIGTDGQNA